MKPYLANTRNESSLSNYQMQNSLIKQLKSRFKTYGYTETGTSSFQDYDLYSSVIGTVNKQDMIKTIDPSGDVLVMRPDVTIPVTRQMASEDENRGRLFYVQNVYRQPGEKSHHKELTQAGVECFGENTLENDAEMIAMATHILKDLQFGQFKIEISHAGFFKELIEKLPLSQEESQQLQQLIKSKNLTEIAPFLDGLSIDDDIKDAVKTIPMLYGSPESVIEKASTITINQDMQETIDNLKQVYNILTAYGVEDSVVFDLGLINHMNYYSGIIFQGYVASYNKPVLMGGRYNDLAEQFGAEMPAIGFGCFVNHLLEALQEDGKQPSTEDSVELVIYYDQHKMADALSAANRLRDTGYQVITVNNKNDNNINTPSLGSIYFEEKHCLLINQQKQLAFQDIDELENMLEKEMRDN